MNRDRYISARDAGGGPGKGRLHFHVLNETQKELYKRTLEPTFLEAANIEQERRQINTLITIIDLKVNVAREDFPAVNAYITLSFQPYQATQAWQKFIADVSKAIGLEFIDCIVDRKDGSPVHRAMRLRQGGTYFARQRESSSILEVLVTSVPPVQFIWEVTKDIAKVKEELEDGFKDQEKITTRVAELITRPKHREEEKTITDAILQAEHPLDIVDAIDDMIHSNLVEKKVLNEENQVELNNKVIPSDILTQRNKIITQKDMDHQKNPKLWHFDKSVDIVSLHRLALEHLNRMALVPKQHNEKKEKNDDDSDEESEEEYIPLNVEIIVKECLGFILETIENFRYETDVNVIGLRCLADLIPHLGTERIKVMEAILNNIQIYAPERPDFRGPRIVPRIQPDRKPIEEPVEDEVVEEPKVREKKKKKIEDDEDSEEEEKREKARIEWELEFKRQQEEEAKQKAEEEKRNMKPLRFIPKKRWSGMKGELLKPPEKKPENPFLKIKKTKEKEKVKAEPVVRSRKKLQVAMKGLPVVPGISFRGFPNLMKKNMILVQSFATLFKLIDFSYPNRDAAFKLSLHEEIAEIGQVCQSMPQVLEYILWIINSMYRDGFAMGEDANDVNSVNASMQVTESMPTKNNDDDNQSIDPLTGKVIEAISSLSGVTVTMEDIKTDTPRVNKGDPNRHYDEEPEFWDRPADFYMQGDGKSNITGKNLEDMMPLPMKVPDNTNDRYSKIPGDDVLITLGMISHHLDLDEADRGIAHKWLTLWDDCSPHFKKMVQKGINLIDL